jgi:uncharacterized protein YkwD
MKTRPPTHHIVLISFAALLAGLLAGCAFLGQTKTYTVRPGDTLAQIAAAHDTTVDELVALNADRYPSLETDPGAIEVGWTLDVPGQDGGLRLELNTPSPNMGAPTAVPLDRDAFEAQVLRLVNEERTQAGLAPLSADPGMMEFARRRSEDMVARGYFSHYDPETGADLTPNSGENISRQGTRWSAPRIQEIVNGWMESTGHRENILDGGATRTGVGVAVGDGYVIVTQLFE